MLWPSNPNALMLPGLFDVLPKCTNEHKMITGYPEYETDYRKLGPNQQDVLDSIAREIVFSHSTNTPIIAVLVQGHADVALKLKHNPAQQKEKEQQVSENRATSGMELLKRKIEDTPPKGREIAASIKFKTQGMGSGFPLRPGAFTEDQMRMNRRVEFFWARCFVPEPPALDTLTKRIQRLQELLKTRKLPDLPGREPTPEHRQKRVHCLLEKMKRPNVIDVFVDGYAKNEQMGKFFVGQTLADWNGNYDPPLLSDADFAKFLGTVGVHLRSAGFDPKNPDDKVLELLSHLMLRIDLGISQVDDYVRRNPSRGWPNPQYTGDHARKKLQNIYRERSDPDNIYSCYQ